jgi:hypothetical protein
MISEGEGFTVIGDDEEQSPDDFAGLAPRDVVVIDQQLYEDDGYFDKGRHVGWAHGSGVVTHRVRIVCHVTFVFEEGDTLAAHGVLPIEGRTIGNGLMAVTGGTGRYRNAGGTMYVETVNPKRWKYDPDA